jgi:hypothetical protein
MIIYSNGWQAGKTATNTVECLGFVIGKNISKLEIFSDVASGSSIVVYVIDAINSQQICEIIVNGNNTIKYSSTVNINNLPTDDTLYKINYNIYSGTTGVLFGVKLFD